MVYLIFSVVLHICNKQEWDYEKSTKKNSKEKILRIHKAFLWYWLFLEIRASTPIYNFAVRFSITFVSLRFRASWKQNFDDFFSGKKPWFCMCFIFWRQKTNCLNSGLDLSWFCAPLCLIKYPSNIFDPVKIRSQFLSQYQVGKLLTCMLFESTYTLPFAVSD